MSTEPSAEGRRRVRENLVANGYSEAKALELYPDPDEPCQHLDHKSGYCDECRSHLSGPEMAVAALIAQDLAAEEDPTDFEFPDPDQRCQCGHKRKHHDTPAHDEMCGKCLWSDGDRVTPLHSFTATTIPRQHGDKMPEPAGFPMSVVYQGFTGPARELLIPPGSTVSLAGGGILVQHEDFEVTTILSVRPMRPQGESRAPEADVEHEER